MLSYLASAATPMTRAHLVLFFQALFQAHFQAASDRILIAPVPRLHGSIHDRDQRRVFVSLHG